VVKEAKDKEAATCRGNGYTESGPARPYESSEMEEAKLLNNWDVLYANADSLINKRQDL